MKVRQGKHQITLARALSKFGVASRVQARLLIRKGGVSVNSRVVRSPDVWIDPCSDHITLNGKTLVKREPIYLVLNKPAGTVTTRADELARKTIYDLLPAKTPWLFPVGRLDMESSGLLILTNDTKFGEMITNPSTGIPKVYVVHLDKPLKHDDCTRLESPVTLEDGTIVLPVIIRPSSGEPKVCEVTIREGKNRQVRRMFKVLGYEVVALKRISIGPVELGQLPEGEVRKITGEELRLITQKRVMATRHDGATRKGKAPGIKQEKNRFH